MAAKKRHKLSSNKGNRHTKYPRKFKYNQNDDQTTIRRFSNNYLLGLQFAVIWMIWRLVGFIILTHKVWIESGKMKKEKSNSNYKNPCSTHLKSFFLGHNTYKDPILGTCCITRTKKIWCMSNNLCMFFFQVRLCLW